jgi:hypothetical protein
MRLTTFFPGAMGALLAASSMLPAETPPAGGRWFKGNLHTHTLWSDGNDYPEMIADWYKREGYEFLALSDHNVLQEGERWLELKQPISTKGDVNYSGGGPVLEKYLARFGADWVERRERDGKKEVRLKTLAEYRGRLEEPGRFLMIPSEEITATWKRAAQGADPEKTGPVHINATNPRELIAPVKDADNALAIMQQTIDAVLAQRARTGQPMFTHINHPNFVWGITAEELMQVHGEQFFEVYNGHPGVNNAGDPTRLSTDQIWDVVLTRRLAELKLPPMFALGVDDAHAYHTMGIGKSNPGRGWIMVRARELSAEAIIGAMEAGDFYATSGVTLIDVQRSGDRLAVEIATEPGVTYVTQFIGTRRGYDPTNQLLLPVESAPARKSLPHRRYSRDVGTVLAETKGKHAAYTLRGDEFYVRAKIVSSKPKANGSVEGEFETAWTQPLIGPAAK